MGGLLFGLGAVILLAISGGNVFSASSPFGVIAGGGPVRGALVGLFAPTR